MTILTVVWIGLFIFAFVILAKSIRVVPQRSAFIVERLGKYKKTLTGFKKQNYKAQKN